MFRGRCTRKHISTPGTLILLLYFATFGKCNILDYLWQSILRRTGFGHQNSVNPQMPGTIEQPNLNQAHPLNQHIAPNHDLPLQPNPHYAPAVPNHDPTYGQIPQTPNLYPPNSQYVPLPQSGQRYPQYPGMAPNPQYPGMAPNPQYPGMAPNPQYPAMAPNPQYPAMAPNPQYSAMAPNLQYPAMTPYLQNPAMAPNPQYPAMAPYPQNQAMAPNPQYPAAVYPQYSAIGHPQYVSPAVQPQRVPAPPVDTESAFSRYLRYAAYGMNILGNILQMKHNHRQQKTLSQIEQHHRQLTPHGGMYPMPHHQLALQHTVHHHHEVHVIPHPHGQHVIPRAHETRVITHPNGQHVIPRAHETHVVPHPHGQHVIPRAHETHIIPHTHGQHVIPRARETHVIPNTHETHILPRAQVYA